MKELEGIVLGYVFKTGPCTAYQVRKLLKGSPSSQWQASAGSIYPLLERLERNGLVEAEADNHDLRARRALIITNAGKKALKSWVKAGSQQEVVSAISDPIRTRIFFLDALTSREREVLLQDMLSAMEDFLAVCENDLATRPADEHSDSSSNYLGALGAVMANRARVDYLKSVAELIQPN